MVFAYGRTLSNVWIFATESPLQLNGVTILNMFAQAE